MVEDSDGSVVASLLRNEAFDHLNVETNGTNVVVVAALYYINMC
jgi:hypothetical protein